MAAVISASELNRIKQSLLPEAERQATSGTGLSDAAKKAQAAELRAKSQARAQTWGNTLEGGRRKKAEEKRKKMEMEELERQKIDAEEAKIQLEQRRATIDRANKLLYDEADRMKSFHSKMMLCDVMAEREAQMNLKEELAKLEHIREERFMEMERQNYRKMLERELTEQQQKEAIAKVALKTQKQQLAEFKEKQFKEIEDSMVEGELLRRKALEDIEEEKKAEGRRRKQAVKAVEETQKANDYLKQIKAEDLLRQAKEEEKIEEYARRKEHMMELRKKKEEEVFAAKQAQRQAIIEKQAAQLAEMQNNEEQRVERQVMEKEIADEKKRLDKEEQLQRWQDDINKSRKQQISRKQEARDREKTEDRETAQFLGEWCKVLDKQEKEEQLIKKSALVRLSSEHKKQVEIQRRRKTEQKRVDDQVAIRAKNAMEADTVEFHGYAEACIREYAEEGKNVIPLIKELREFRKRVLE